MDISLKAPHTQDTMQSPHEAQEEGDQSVGALVPLRRGTKYLQKQKMEIKYGTETELKAIQRLSYLGIHPMNSHQTLTLL